MVARKRKGRKAVEKKADPDKPESVRKAEEALVKALEEAGNGSKKNGGKDLAKPAEPMPPTPEEVALAQKKYQLRVLRRTTKTVDSVRRALKALAKSLE